MVEIIKEIVKMMPEGTISDASFEGANIVLYTKDKEFFVDNKGLIREAVEAFKKRIELRPDPSKCLDPEKAEKVIRKFFPEDAGISQILFDPQRSIVIIEAEKPGLAIGKQGSMLKDLREQIMWVPYVRRTPAIKSPLIENIRAVLYQHSDYRRKFLDKIGHRIYDGWTRAKKSEWVRLTYLGGGRQVGRSCLFLQTPESRILLDCGINVAADTPEEMYPHMDAPEFNIADLDAVVLTHAHIDHSGFIPYLYKMGFRGPVYCTAPTRDISALICLDSVKIAKAENQEPLFDQDDIKEMVKHTITLEYEEVHDITPDVRITMYNAGHILGSAVIHMNIGNGLHNFVYTGDIKFGRSVLLEPTHCQFPRCETLTLEATYGGKNDIQPPGFEADQKLCEAIKATVARGGKVLMPVLGTGKAQDVMVMIERLVRSKELAPLPVYLDGMLWDITAIHTAYPEFLNQELRRLIFHKDENPFLSAIFKRVGSVKERQDVIEYEGPCVILATSGMLTGGPSVEYLKNLADNPKNALVFTCYLPEGTLGHRIFNMGAKELVFKHGVKQEVCKINLEVMKITVSDHADRKQLMNYIYKVYPKPKRVLVNHGEISKCLDLASSIHKQHRIETIAPRNLDTLRLR